MNKNRYLEGENIKPTTIAEARKLVGKYVKYLRSRDIDKSGRGYFFPQYGEVVSAKGKNLAIDDLWTWVSFSEIVEMVILENDD